jgi:hypothetical protein
VTGPPPVPCGSIIPVHMQSRFGLVGPSTEQKYRSQTVKAWARAHWNGMSAWVKYPIVDGPLACTQRSIVPLFQARCWAGQERSVPGVACALVALVSRWNGAR